MIHVIGIGPGRPDFLTQEVLTLVQDLDLILGAQRQIAAFPKIDEGKKELAPNKLSHLKDRLIELNDQGLEIGVLASGDPSLYGIGRYLIQELGKDKVVIHPGISSIQYLFAKIGVPMNDVYLSSSHGKEPAFSMLASLSKLAMVTDQKWGPYQIAQALLKESKTVKRMYIGQELSYPDETIESFLLDQVPDKDYQMNVVVITDEG